VFCYAFPISRRLREERRMLGENLEQARSQISAHLTGHVCRQWLRSHSWKAKAAQTANCQLAASEATISRRRISKIRRGTACMAATWRLHCSSHGRRATYFLPRGVVLTTLLRNIPPIQYDRLCVSKTDARCIE